MPDDVAFLAPIGGMNGSGDAARLPQEQYRRAVNVTLVNGLPTTRPGVRINRYQSEDSTVADFFRSNNHQGAKFFNPSKGQSGLTLGKDESQIVVANGGRKFSLKVEGYGGATEAVLTDITNGYFASSLLHLVWWECAENYAIATDGLANTFIYDANSEAFLSTGYDSVDKESSQFPNGATVTTYAHGRLCTVVNGNQILTGDSIHKSDQSSAVNLLGFTEQVYWNTGQYFMPPSSMGSIIAGDILPLRDTRQGHTSLIWHCQYGVFSLDINIAPRSSWSSQALTKHLLVGPGTAAAGYYALALYDGDQIYRTIHGIATLRSAAAVSTIEGNPQSPYSDPIETFLLSDVSEWLRFCSVVGWADEKKLFCTVDPCVDGRYRWHRGIVVRNFAPTPGERGEACWEGLWTLPSQAAGIVQMVSGLFPRERVFAFCFGDDGENRLVEFTSDLLDDVLEDGSRQKIRCQLLSREMDFTAPFLRKEFLHGTLFPKNVKGRVEWGVWIRIKGRTKLVFWRAGVIDVAETSDEFGLEMAEPFSEPIALGNIPSECTTNFKSSRAMQFLIRWKGHMQIETLRIHSDIDASKEEKLDTSKFSIVKNEAMARDYDDFEYGEGVEWIIEPTT